MIIFETPGEFDLRLLTTMGLTIKPNANAFGKFGTGVKYGIAGIVRLNGLISIWIAGKEWKIRKSVESVRGQDVEFLWLTNGKRKEKLPFTADLGKHWEPWALYREFWANTQDEGGKVYDSQEGHYQRLSDHTYITIECAELDTVRKELDKYFLPRDANRWGLSGFGTPYPVTEPFHTQTRTTFYQGIRINQLDENDGLGWKYKWDLSYAVELTEDRTLPSTWTLRYRMARAFLSQGTLELWEKIAEEPCREQLLDFPSKSDIEWGDETKEYWLTKFRTLRGKAGSKWFPPKIWADCKALIGEEVAAEVLMSELPDDWGAALKAAPPMPGTSFEVKDSIMGYDQFAVNAKIKALHAAARYWYVLATKLAAELGRPMHGTATVEAPEIPRVPEETPF